MKPKGMEREYNSWQSMKSRCYNPNDPAYPRYGGRGITVCDKWRRSFAEFVADMGPRPDGTSIDRIENSLGYFKENCRWATRIEQQNNMKTCVYIEVFGQRKTVTQWEREKGVIRGTILARIKKGWNPVEAVQQPIRAWTRSKTRKLA